MKTYQSDHSTSEVAANPPDRALWGAAIHRRFSFSNDIEDRSVFDPQNVTNRKRW